MNAIYEPRGPAYEYAPLACNLYRGCGHGCRYCYAPACLRIGREEFSQPAPRPGILQALRKDAAALRVDPRPVLLSFTSDPYQPIEEEYGLTRSALTILGEAGLTIRLLTKNPLLAMRDLDLMVRHGVEFGVSLVWAEDGFRRTWEPNASPIDQRLGCLWRARAAGLRTWVSMEPVIEAEEALAVLRVLAGTVDVVKIGKLNHDAQRERRVDWPAFTAEAMRICCSAAQAYYVKNDLWKACAGAAGQHQWWPRDREF